MRREVLDRLPIFGGWQLRLVLAEYANHYNVHRPHRALGSCRRSGSASQRSSCRLGGSCGEIDWAG